VHVDGGLRAVLFGSGARGRGYAGGKISACYLICYVVFCADPIKDYAEKSAKIAPFRLYQYYGRCVRFSLCSFMSLFMLNLSPCPKRTWREVVQKGLPGT